METSDSIVNDESFLDRPYYLSFDIRNFAEGISLGGRNLFLKIIFLPRLSIRQLTETTQQSYQFTKLDLIIEFVRSKRLYL